MGIGGGCFERNFYTIYNGGEGDGEEGGGSDARAIQLGTSGFAVGGAALG